MKFQLGSKASDIFITIYLVCFLCFRFSIENQFRGKYSISMLFGVMTLLFLYALIKNKILNPDYFGLMRKKDTRSSRRRANKEQAKKLT